MTHTPGPWLINFDPEDDERPLEIVTSDRDHRIAYLASDGNPDDARLISAAPALLAACVALEAAEDANANCTECEGLGVPELCPVCFPLFDDARLKRYAALALADGET